MKVAIIVPPKNFSDETLSKLLLVLHKWNIDVTLSSYTTSQCIGLHGAIYTPDVNTAKLNPLDYSALLLVDGPGVDSYRLQDFKPLIDLTKLFIKENKIIGAFGNSVKIFIRANGFTPGKISAQESAEVRSFAATSRYVVTDKGVEVYKNLITATNSGNAIELANELLVKLGVK